MIRTLLIGLVVLFGFSAMADNVKEPGTTSYPNPTAKSDPESGTPVRGCRFEIHGNGGTDVYKSTNMSNVYLQNQVDTKKSDAAHACPPERMGRPYHLNNGEIFSPMELVTNGSTGEKYYMLQFPNDACVGGYDGVLYVPVTATRALNKNCKN